ncbi:ABC transporter permease [Myroides sp. LJL119]
MSVLSLIIKREFVAKVRNKSFIVMTFLGPVFFILLTGLIAYLSTMKADVKQIAVYDPSGIFIQEFENNSEYNYSDVSSVDLAILKDNVQQELYYGLLYFPNNQTPQEYENSITYISNESPSLSFISKVELLVNNKLTHINLENTGMDIAIIDAAQANVNLKLEKTSGEQTIKGLNEIKVVLGGLFGYFIMMFIIIYGNMVMRSVIEEKTNRIIEIIISSVKPFQLMMGKIIGTSLAGVLQFLIWGVLGVVFMVIASMVFGVELSPNVPMPDLQELNSGLDVSQTAELQGYISEILSLPLFSLTFYFILYFIGGYFLYSSLYAAIGAAVDNETDSQQFLLPILLPLMLGVYIGFFTVMNDPHGSVATIFSMIPFTSPIVMLMRIPFGVPVWQVIVSLVLLFGTFLLVVWLSAKIYRIGILMYGKKPSWKELYKWLGY